jgi:hypothetical protein
VAATSAGLPPAARAACRHGSGPGLAHTARVGHDQRPDPPVGAATYWKRRFFVLAAGLAVLAVIAWGLSGALNSGRAAGLAGRGAHSHAHSSSPGPASSASQTPSNSPAPSPSATSSTPAAKRKTQNPPPTAHGPTGNCPRRDVVLSLFPAQTSFSRAQPPQFSVDVVSTASRTCTFNVGPKFLTVTITAGKDRVWGSADCLKLTGRGVLLTKLVRGIPTVLPVTWDLRTSVPGCSQPQSRARSGSYAAVATDDGLSSAPAEFRVR